MTIAAVSPRRVNHPKAQSSEELLRQNGLLRAPVDLDALAKRLGIDVTLDALDDDISGFLIVKNAKAGICINALHHPNRQRFTFAHELAHFVIHHSTKEEQDDFYIDKSLLYLRGKQRGRSESPMEREADQYAASLLMPESLIRSWIQENNFNPSEEIDLYRLTMAFRVSEQAMQIRLSDLRIIK